MNKINSIQFHQELSKGGVAGCIILDSVSIVNSGPFANSIIISNCIFEENFFLSKCSVRNSLVFKDCTFKSEVKFSNSTFESELLFNNCKLSGVFKINTCSYSSLTFEEGDINELCFSGPISQISKSNTVLVGGNFGKIDIEAREFGSELEIKSISAHEVFFSGTEFQKNIRLDDENLIIDWLYIDKCNFNQRLDLKKGTISEFLDLRKSNFHDTVLISSDFKIKHLSLSNVFSEHSFTLNYFKNIGSISISSCNFEDELLCHTDYDKEKIDDDLSISLEGILKGKLIFENLSISYFDVRATNLGIISINNVDVWNFTAVALFNLNSFIINNLKSNGNNSFFVVSESNVGKMELLNTNLKMFNEVVISSSNVSEIVLSNSALPEIIQIANNDPRIGYGPSEGLQLKDSSFFRETYRQLKIASEKQGNRNQALNYKAKEFHYLRMELPFGWDKILLYFNYISNNHGLSWVRGVVFTLLITLVFFIAYNQTLLDKYFYWTFETSAKEIYKAFLVGFEGYIDFLSSFPKIVLNEEKLTNTSSKIVVFLARIFMGYGIYQTISAFRKYGKN